MAAFAGEVLTTEIDLSQFFLPSSSVISEILNSNSTEEPPYQNDDHFPQYPRLVRGENGYEYYQYDTGQLAWVLIACAILLIMVPGVGYLYNGMARKESSLQLLIMCFWILSTVTVQWYMFGYSISTTPENFTNGMIGNFDHAFLMGVYDQPAPGNPQIPALLYCAFLMLFAAITPCIIIGSTAERAKFLPTVIFIFLWTTCVYDFIAYWAWNPLGWSNRLGVLDFAGGGPVHIATGVSSLALTLILGRRDGYDKNSKPHNVGTIILATSFLWFGWTLFNAGSGFNCNFRAIMTFMVTNMAACTGGLTWCFIDYFKSKKLSAVGFCSGAIIGLIVITPASGFVNVSYSIIFGVVGTIVCYYVIALKAKLYFDDAFDVFSFHGVGGIVGTLLTGIFAQKEIAAKDGFTDIRGGWVNENWMQLAYQMLYILAITLWSFVISLTIIFGIEKTIGFRSKLQDERDGLDFVEIGESTYGTLFDNPPKESPTTVKNSVQNALMNDEDKISIKAKVSRMANEDV